MAYALCVRKQQQSLFTYSWFSNPLLLLAVGGTLALQLIVIYVPFFNTVFRTTPLRWEELSVCAAGAGVIIVITELKKNFSQKQESLINRKFKNSNDIMAMLTPKNHIPLHHSIANHHIFQYAITTTYCNF
jgi:magnesium-transporting ATPase (P-type)